MSAQERSVVWAADRPVPIGVTEAVEEWRQIPGRPEYFASSLGRIKSTLPWRGTSERILTPRLGDDGKYRVTVHGQGGRDVPLLHHLIAAAFHGPRPEGLETRHLDGDGTNNRPENLRYGTHLENEMDKLRHQTHHLAWKTHCKWGHPLPERAPGQLGRRACTPCTSRRTAEFRARQRGAA